MCYDSVPVALYIAMLSWFVSVVMGACGVASSVWPGRSGLLPDPDAWGRRGKVSSDARELLTF